MAVGAHSDPQGSIWRRWDPHVHMPGTRLSDAFDGGFTVSDALEALASCSPPIEAVGVTDYLTTEGYRLAEAAWEAGAGQPGIRMLFPNVELRLEVGTASGSGVNLHLLADPEDVDELDHFLGLLEFRRDDRTFRATRSELVDLGRRHRDDDTLAEDAALREGTNQFKVSLREFMERRDGSRWARERLLIGVAAGTGDGTSGLQDPGGAFVTVRQEIERLAHIMLTGNPKDHEFWLGRGVLTPAQLDAQFGGLRLCIHGSDAHDEARLGVPDQDRFTWLKGDASFETLRQACISPEVRALVGPAPPDVDRPLGRISEVALVADWFPGGALAVNPGLVAIIGARGSGKTALADLIACGAGSEHPFLTDSSFVYRAGDLLDSTVVSVDWTNGDVTTCAFPHVPEPTDGSPSVRYLSQQFVEQLCASDGISRSLLAEIERVVFSRTPIGNRLEATSFQELLDIRLQSARSRQASHHGAVLELGAQVDNQRRLRDSLPSLELAREEVTKAAGGRQAEILELTKATDRLKAERLAAVGSALSAREQQLQHAARRQQSLESLRQAVDVARSTELVRLTERLAEHHQGSGLTAEQWENFALDFVGDVDEILARESSKAADAWRGLAGDLAADGNPLDSVSEANLLGLTVAELSKEQARLQELAGIDQQRALRLSRIRDEISGLNARGAQIDADIVAAKAATSRLADLTTARLGSYASYFDALLEEERELDDLYAPLREVLSAGGASLATLEFSVRRNVDIQQWCAEGEQLLDLRREGPFRGRGVLEGIAREKLLDAWETGDGAAAAAALRRFSDDHSSDLRNQSNARGADAETYRDWEADVTSWLYGAEHVTLSYSLNYEGLEIERLSPGSRGIVLLLLYLAVDLDESIPLIIDQPEENLDPESVYLELVKLFRLASERRQVIMVTHNANLVVNAEADQVIVANCGALAAGRLPEFRYLSGGLENPDVRAAVCQILEGGEDAFRDRARRLRIGLR